MRKQMAISLTAGVVLSTVTLYLAFRNVRFEELTGYLFRIQYAWAVPAFLLMAISYVFRVARWRIILSSTARISFWNAFHPMTIGFMLNCILPARIGEIVRPAILKTRENIPFTTGLATVAAERVLDVLILIASFAVATRFIHIDPTASHIFGDHILNRETLATINRNMIIFCLIMIAGILMVAHNPMRLRINRLIMAFPNLLFFTRADFRDRIRNSICRPACESVDNIARGFLPIKEPVKLMQCLILSVILWVLMALSYHVLAMGFPGLRLSFTEMFAVMIIVSFIIALPSVPGYWGLWEAGGVFAMSLFGAPEKEALGFSLVNHVFQIVPVILLGILSAIIYGIDFTRLRSLTGGDVQSREPAHKPLP